MSLSKQVPAERLNGLNWFESPFWAWLSHTKSTENTDKNALCGVLEWEKQMWIIPIILSTNHLFWNKDWPDLRIYSFQIIFDILWRGQGEVDSGKAQGSEGGDGSTHHHPLGGRGSNHHLQQIDFAAFLHHKDIGEYIVSELQQSVLTLHRNNRRGHLALFFGKMVKW